MNSIMEIDDYQAIIRFDAEIGLFRGEFIGLSGGADFYADSVAGLQQEGRTSLQVFLDMCEEDGVNPRREYSGEVALHVSPELHQRIALMAEVSGQTLDSWTRGVLERAVGTA